MEGKGGNLKEIAKIARIAKIAEIEKLRLLRTSELISFSKDMKGNDMKGNKDKEFEMLVR